MFSEINSTFQEDPEKARAQLATYLYDFGKDLDNGFFVVQSDDCMVSSYKTKGEPFVAFAITSTEAKSRVYAYPHDYVFQLKQGDGRWNRVDDIPDSHKDAIDDIRSRMDDALRREAQEQRVRKPARGILRLLRRK